MTEINAGMRIKAIIEVDDAIHESQAMEAIKQINKDMEGVFIVIPECTGDECKISLPEKG